VAEAVKYLADLVDPRILGCRSTFPGIKNLNWGRFDSSSINKVEPRMKLLVFFSEKSLLSSPLLWWVAISFFFFARWRKEREKREKMGVAVELLLFGSLISAKHHFSR